MSKIILVTGASSGFGRLASERLARAGHTVYAAMRDAGTRNAPIAAELAALAKAGDLKLRTIEMDVTSTESVNAAVAQIVANDGRIDVAINNAGRMFGGIAETFSVEQLQLELDTNLVGAFRVVKAVLPHMRAQKSGQLIHISSVWGRVTNPFAGMYAASKFGMEGLMQAIAQETNLLGIDTTIVEPGPFRTNVGMGGVMPADIAIAGEYGAAGAACKAFFDGFGAFMAQPNPLLDPQLVADLLAELVDMPAGTRPIRKTVGMDFGVAAYNAAVAPFEQGMLDGQQLGFLTGPRSAS
jgi:NAD(P)-dependent dehydrogenase (short-subunit alcohol dehydrogenase family)